MKWEPIETAPVQPYTEETWFQSGPSVLLWNGNWCEIGSYSYTRKGAGRWRSNRGVVTATHWMPLPEPPNAELRREP